MIVKTSARTFDLFEAFAELKQPLSLSALAEQLDIPVSSCFGLLKTAEARGYIYGVKQRGPFYPTRRMLAIAREIAAHDPVSDRVGEALSRLRDETGETVVLGKRSGDRVLYLDIHASPQRIRYMAQIGEAREFHCNAIGKALLGMMPRAERHSFIETLSLTPQTERTLTDGAALEADLDEVQRRGWSRNLGESIADVSSIACGLLIDREPYGISVAGPMQRIEPKLDLHAEALLRIAAELADREPARQRKQIRPGIAR